MAKKAKVEKELRLEDILFNCRDQLRGKASMADKRDLLLTLVFLRFIGENSLIKEKSSITSKLQKDVILKRMPNLLQANWSISLPMPRQVCSIFQKNVVGKPSLMPMQMRHYQ